MKKATLRLLSYKPILTGWCQRYFKHHAKPAPTAQILFNLVFEADKAGLDLTPPFVHVVEYGGEKWVLAQGKDPRFIIAVPFPFEGWTDEYKFVPPYKGDEDKAAWLALL